MLSSPSLALQPDVPAVRALFSRCNAEGRIKGGAGESLACCRDWMVLLFVFPILSFFFLLLQCSRVQLTELPFVALLRLRSH